MEWNGTWRCRPAARDGGRRVIARGAIRGGGRRDARRRARARRRQAVAGTATLRSRSFETHADHGRCAASSEHTSSPPRDIVEDDDAIRVRSTSHIHTPVSAGALAARRARPFDDGDCIRAISTPPPFRQVRSLRGELDRSRDGALDAAAAVAARAAGDALAAWLRDKAICCVM